MLESIQQQILDTLTAVVVHIPNLVGGLLLLLAGWLLARFFHLLVTRFIRTLNHLLDRQFRNLNLHFVRIPAVTEKLIGFVVFWATILVFAIVAIRVVGVAGATVWLDRLMVYLPSLMAGGLIILSGYILGSVVRHLVTHAAASADIAQAVLLGQIAQISFFIVGVVMGLGQVGVDVSFLVILFGIAFAAVLTGFSLAFGLGARSLVENLIAARHLKEFVRPGQLVETGNERGRVLEFTATGMVVETDDGRKLIPARLCMEQSFSVVTRELTDDKL